MAERTGANAMDPVREWWILDRSLDHYVRPIVADGDYGFERVSVVAQRNDPDSLLNWLVALIRTRRECPEIGAGRC